MSSAKFCKLRNNNGNFSTINVLYSYSYMYGMSIKRAMTCNIFTPLNFAYFFSHLAQHKREDLLFFFFVMSCIAIPKFLLSLSSIPIQ